MRMNDDIWSHATFSLHCPRCGDNVEIFVPVRVWIEEDENVIKANVDNSKEWQQPLWDHILLVHGPMLE